MAILSRLLPRGTQMRGIETGQGVMFSYVSLDARVPGDHPLRAMQRVVEPVLTELSPRFATLYAEAGRPSIPPEQLLRALLLQVLYSIRSERQLMEQLDYNLLFRWFVGLGLDEPVWHPTTFTKNRDRLLAGHLAEAFLAGVLRQAEAHQLLSREHFSVDGTLLEAWASQASFQRDPEKGAEADAVLPAVPKHRRKFLPPDDPRRGPPAAPTDRAATPPREFHGTRRSNATHTSTTDPDARLARKGDGQPARLCYQGSVLVDNRHGLVVATAAGVVSGRAEWEQATEMLSAVAADGVATRRATVGADKGYDQRAFVAAVRGFGCTPHVAQHISARHPSAIDGRTTRHVGYAMSQHARKRVEQPFGWGKVIGPLRKLKHRGPALVEWIFTFTMAVYDLVRIRTLLAARAVA
jgi:transposase